MSEQLKIISGGQTGVDRAALGVAMSLDIEHGGWCAPSRESDDGPIDKKYNLKETPKERSDRAPDIPRSLRTEWNVRDSDGTLILTTANPPYDPGTTWTIKAAALYNKPLVVANPSSEESVGQVLEWLQKNHIRTLNVAGPTEKSIPGIGGIVYKFMLSVIK